MIEYRTMVHADVPAGLLLCRLAGWNQLDTDWNIYLKSNPTGSRVAVDESGNVVGTVATINYNRHFSWIGMVLVDPTRKRQGIGTRLLQEALKILDEQATVKLDATPAGREVYLKLGFKDEYTLSRMELNSLLAVPGGTAEPISPDLPDKIKLTDEEVFGAPRTHVLQELLSFYPEMAKCITDKLSLAYCFGRRGFLFTQIGPVVAESCEQAIELTSAVIKDAPHPIIMDVHDGSRFQEWLFSVGFTEQRKLIRMFKGTNRYPGKPAQQFAILGPEFG